MNLPTIETPITESGDELRVNIENLYHPEKSPNPVYVFKQYDFNIDREGNFLIKYVNEDFKVGHINEENVFVLEPPLVMRGPFNIVKPDERGDVKHNFFKYPIQIKPGNFIKIPKTNTGVYGARGLSSKTSKKDKNITPVFTDNDSILTMHQMKLYIQYAVNLDVETRTRGYMNKFHNLGLYVIYQMNTQNMYSKYEFINAVYTHPSKKTEGYFVFKKSEPIRNQQLKAIPEIIEELQHFPEDNPSSFVGKKYRSAKVRFEKGHNQIFLQGDKYANVMKELRRKTRNSKTDSRSKTQSEKEYIRLGLQSDRYANVMKELKRKTRKSKTGSKTRSFSVESQP